MCEYRTYRVYPVGSELHKQLREEYANNAEGCYIIETAYHIPYHRRLCFNAIRRYRDVGRLVNHSRSANLKLSRNGCSREGIKRRAGSQPPQNYSQVETHGGKREVEGRQGDEVETQEGKTEL